MSMVEQLRADANEADALHLRSRRMLVDAVRSASRAGLSQREIAAAIGRSQPEVSRLIRFHGRTPLGRSLEVHRRAILDILSDAGATHVRVFGSVGRGDDGPASDVDLLADFSSTPSLFELARLEQSLGRLVGAEVDLIPAASLRSPIARRALDEAIPL